MKRTVRVLVVGFASAAAIVPACAAAGRTTWTTYLYEGPGQRYAVVDELQQLTPIEVLSCGDRWCQVQVGDRVGFLQADVISRGDPATPASGVLAQPAAALTATPGSDCFDVLQTGGNGGKMPTIVCHK